MSLRLAACVLVALAPLALVFGLGAAFGRTAAEKSKRASFTPPSWVFSVVWAYLTLALGWVTAWTLHQHRFAGAGAAVALALYAAVTLLWSAWIVVDHRERESGGGSTASFCVLLASLVAVSAYLVALGYMRQHHLWLLFPACLWLGVAAALSGVQVHLAAA